MASADALDDGFFLAGDLSAKGSKKHGRALDLGSEAKEGKSDAVGQKKERSAKKRRTLPNPASMGSKGQVEYLTGILAAERAEASSLELEDIGLKSNFVFWPKFLYRIDSYIVLSPGYDGEHELPSLQPFFDSVCKERGIAFALARTPKVLIVAAAALRAIALIRSLPDIRSKHKIAKLFAKHMNPTEQLVFLKSHSIPVAVGTPNRLIKLIEMEPAIMLDGLELVILDSWRDPKQRNLLEMNETRKDVISLIYEHLAPRIKSGDIRIALF